MLLVLTACGGPKEAEPEADAPLDQTSPGQTTPENPDVSEPPTGQPDDTLPETVVVPGERVGPILPTTSRADLAKRFGDDQLSDQDVNIGEGSLAPGTVVEIGEDRTFTVIWVDESRDKPLLVQNFGPAWKTPQGLGVGSSLAELKEKLGDFQLYGFGWDYGGSIVLENTKLDKYHGNLFLRVEPPKAMAEQHPDAYRALSGDTLFESGNPNMEALQPVIYEMTVYLNPLGNE